MDANVAQGFHEARSHLVEFASMIIREAAQHLPSLASCAKDGAALISRVGDALEQAFVLAAIDEFNRAVVPDAETGCGIGDGHERSFRSTRYLEQQLMLLRLQTRVKRRRFAEEEEAAQFVTEVGQSVKQEIRAGIRGLERHSYISYHDIHCPSKVRIDESLTGHIALVRVHVDFGDENHRK